MPIKELPYQRSFSSCVKAVVSEEKDKLLSIASLQELKKFIPNIDIATHIDLLPIAFNACVINRPNKNGDMIDTQVALATYKNFVNKFIDTEHNRQKVIGVILSSSLSEFGTDRMLTEDEVKGTNEPFNITLGGILWKAVNGDLCDLVEESNDPTSTNYLAVSASWELGFSDYNIVEMEQGEKNYATARLLTSPEEVESVKKYLKATGGSGIKDGKCYYRMPNKDVIPMGIGLTEKPAAEVKGVAVNEVPEKDITKNLPSQSTEQEIQEGEQKAISEIVSESKEIISQNQQNNVKTEREYNMKIMSIKDLTDENLKQCSASAISEFIASEIQKASESFSAEKAEKDGMHKKLQDQHDELHKNVVQMKATIDQLKKEKEEQQKMQDFNSRMSEMHALYNFPPHVAKHVADDIKSCADDEMYAGYKAKADAIFQPYLRKADAEGEAKAKAEGEAEGKVCKDCGKSPCACAEGEADASFPGESEIESRKKAESENKNKKWTHQVETQRAPMHGAGDMDKIKAGSNTVPQDKGDVKIAPLNDGNFDTKASVASVLEEVLDNSKQEKAGLPNSSSVGSQGLKEKFQQAFAEENFVIKL